MQVQMRCGDARYAIPYMPLHVLLLLDDDGLRVLLFRGSRFSWFRAQWSPLSLVPGPAMPSVAVWCGLDCGHCIVD